MRKSFQAWQKGWWLHLKKKPDIDTPLNAAINEVKRGQIYGLIIGCLALIASIVSVALGAEKAATVIGGTTVVGLVTVFVLGRFKPAK